MENPDENIRTWALEAAIASTRVGTKPSLIINRAEKFYGFITRSSAEVKAISTCGKFKK